MCLGRARRNYIRHMKQFVCLTAYAPVRTGATGVNFFFADGLVRGHLVLGGVAEAS